MKRIITHFLAAVLLLTVMGTGKALAQTVSRTLEDGHIYRFVNARVGGRSLRADGTDDVHTKTNDLNDKAQDWYVTKDGD